MVDYQMFNRIKHYRQNGISQVETACLTGTDRKTVRKYERMSKEEYAAYVEQSRQRVKRFDPYTEAILAIYEANGFKKLNMDSVYDCLEEEFGKLPANVQSLRNFIRYLIRTKRLVLKPKRRRTYRRVEDLPYGKQMQLDFGQDVDRNGVRRYILATVLSASRYKFAALQDTPFTSEDLIHHLLDCFAFLGGIPEEIVIDQDTLMVVNENMGDIICTDRFKTFMDEMGFRIWVCRKADPESKGKIEAVVKFIKQNFLSTRIFNNFDEANLRLRQWLYRRANGRLCAATRRIPAEMFEEEKQHLKSLKRSIFEITEMVDLESRKVNQCCEIQLDCSTYQVPDDYAGKQVGVHATVDRVLIYDLDTGVQLREHPRQLLPGSHVRDHDREILRGRKLDELEIEAGTWHTTDRWKDFLSENRKVYSRYFRDQLTYARKHLQTDIDSVLFSKALDYCFENKTLSMANLHDTYRYFRDSGNEENTVTALPAKRLKSTPPPPVVAQRDLSYYQKMILKGDFAQ